ncbi:hypothetical protein HK105_201673 [Polyrhizophydium stewartii]|uniref:RRM domain-containing protein n=1 Tax=Polyrhizophydium stewartii TaxID=2732419 RepID=A0ABR4NHA9_9FUNG|nr:hypothetical protein HK105_006881 [Polyrhizophydium stewartii]
MESSNNGSNLFVSGLSLEVRDDDLEKLFSKYGKINKCQVMVDPRTKESRGFGFVDFESVVDADAALALDGAELLGRQIIVQKAKRGRPRTPTPGEYRGPPKDPYGDRRRDDRYDDRRRDDRYGRDRYDDRRRDDRYGRDRYDDRRYDDRYSRDRYDDRRRDDRYGRDRYDDRDRRY